MPNESPEADHVTVSELIAHVSTELSTARRNAIKSGQDPTLELAGATLTLDYEVTKKVDGGLDLKLVQGGAERERRMGNHIELTFTAASTGVAFRAGPRSGPFGPQGPEDGNTGDDDRRS